MFFFFIPQAISFLSAEVPYGILPRNFATDSPLPCFFFFLFAFFPAQFPSAHEELLPGFGLLPTTPLLRPFPETSPLIFGSREFFLANFSPFPAYLSVMAFPQISPYTGPMQAASDCPLEWRRTLP